MEPVDAKSGEAAETAVAEESPPEPQKRNGKPYRVESDLEFIGSIAGQAGITFKRCFQCGTCSATCALSPDEAPFPRKEMVWAAWGLRDRLLTDVWHASYLAQNR